MFGPHIILGMAVNVLMCSVNVVNRIIYFCLIIVFFSYRGFGVSLATLATPGYVPV